MFQRCTLIIICLTFGLTVIAQKTKSKRPIYMGVSVGLDQHLMGGGPLVDILFVRNCWKIGVGLNTQINGLTPYRLKRYGELRFANSVKEAFGGGFSLSFINYHVPIPHPIFGTITYSSNYFYTHFAHNQRKENGNTFWYTNRPGFSTVQSLSGGLLTNIGKGFMLDLMVGGGVYISRYYPSMVTAIIPNQPVAESLVTKLKPDFNIKLSISYMIKLSK